MSLKFIDFNKNSPGPQDYQIQSSKVLNKAPVFSLGKKSKSTQQIDFDHNAFKPGPTAYNSKETLVRTNGTFMGTSDRKDLTETERTPAPNYYKTASASNFASLDNPRCKIGSELRKTDFARP